MEGRYIVSFDANRYNDEVVNIFNMFRHYCGFEPDWDNLEVKITDGGKVVTRFEIDLLHDLSEEHTLSGLLSIMSYLSHLAVSGKADPVQVAYHVGKITYYLSHNFIKRKIVF